MVVEQGIVVVHCENIHILQSADSGDRLDHFSTYALSGKTGKIIWKHEAGDFETWRSAKEVIAAPAQSVSEIYWLSCKNL